MAEPASSALCSSCGQLRSHSGEPVEVWCPHGEAYGDQGDGYTQEAKFEMHRHYLGGIRKPTKKLSGIDDTGQFCTAAAKEYPRAMSKGLAFSVAKTLAARLKQRQRLVQCTEVGLLFEWVRNMCSVSKDIRHDAVMMPDYQR